VGLVVPAIFSTALSTPGEDVTNKVLKISRATSVILLFAYGAFVFFQMRSHHSLYTEVLEADEEKDVDKHRDAYKAKLTATECIVAIVFSITMVTFMALFLVDKIHYIVEEHNIKDA
jgi:Ca2+:H+ antiporter